MGFAKSVVQTIFLHGWCKGLRAEGSPAHVGSSYRGAALDSTSLVSFFTLSSAILSLWHPRQHFSSLPWICCSLLPNNLSNPNNFFFVQGLLQILFHRLPHLAHPQSQAVFNVFIVLSKLLASFNVQGSTPATFTAFLKLQVRQD